MDRCHATPPLGVHYDPQARQGRYNTSASRTKHKDEQCARVHVLIRVVLFVLLLFFFFPSILDFVFMQSWGKEGWLEELNIGE
jgi:hypothetical protein